MAEASTIKVEAPESGESLETESVQVNSVELKNEGIVESTNAAIKVEAFESDESSETGCVQVNSVVLKNEENTNAIMSEEHKEQDLHEAVLKEKVLSDEAGKQQESKGNDEESREEETGTKIEECMVMDEDDDVQKLDESTETQREKAFAEEKDIETMDQDKEARYERPDHPILATITVNIGPLRLEDLDSDQMRDILNYSKGYTLSFEKKEEGLLSKEKERARHEGYAEIPYLFYNDAYLMKTYNKLRNLRIDNRDLSVTFPEDFIKVAEECSARIRLKQEGRRKIQDMRRAKVETKKKSLFAKNIPPNIQEETLKAEFPGCTNVVIPKNSEGISIGFAVLEFETVEELTKCLETHDLKDIQNHKIRLSKIALDGSPDGSQKKGRQQKGNQGRGNQKGNRGRNQQQRGNQRWENRRRGNRQNRQRDDRSHSGERRSPRNDRSRRQSGPYNRDVPMPPPLMGNISTWSRYDNGRGSGESGYNRQDNRGSGPKRSRSPDGRDQKRFRGEGSYGRMEDSRQRGDARQGNGSGWGGPANTSRSRSPDGEAEATLSYLRQQLAVMEKKLVHSQAIPAAGPVSSPGRSYGSGGHTALPPAGPVSSSGRSYGSGGLAAVPPAGPVSSSGRSYGSGYSSGGHTGAVGGYSSGTQASGYGSSVRPVSGYPSSGYTSSGYSYSGYGSGSHTSTDSLLGTYPTYPSGGQPRSGGGSSRIEDAYNKFMNSISGR